jgi:tetratricopeptide (TPR) repeat protein
MHHAGDVGRWLLILSWLIPARVTAQSAAELIARGDSANPFMHPAEALAIYQAAIGADSNSLEAWWKAGRALVDVAKQIEQNDDRSRARRDSLYFLARDYAVRAIRINQMDANPHFVQSLALGRLALTKGQRERVKYGSKIYSEGAFALVLDSLHDGAHHVVGVFHAEVKRLSAPVRFFARLIYGSKLLGASSWDSATVHLERAVQLNPGDIYHRLELARVYLDINRKHDAAAQLDTIGTLPDADVLDPEYRRRAAELLAGIRKKGGR